MAQVYAQQSATVEQSSAAASNAGAGAGEPKAGAAVRQVVDDSEEAGSDADDESDQSEAGEDLPC